MIKSLRHEICKCLDIDILHRTLGGKVHRESALLLSEGSDDTVEDIHALSPALTKNGSLLHEPRSVPSARTVMTHV